jgi:hypothetical protein
MWHNLLGLKETSERRSSRKECFVYEITRNNGRAREAKEIADGQNTIFCHTDAICVPSSWGKKVQT